MDAVTISTHVLDTATGAGVAGVQVDVWTTAGEQVAGGLTGPDGRLRLDAELAPGDYVLRFELDDVSALYRSASFEVSLREARHHHLPVLVAPYGITAYRGS